MPSRSRGWSPLGPHCSTSADVRDALSCGEGPSVSFSPSSAGAVPPQHDFNSTSLGDLVVELVSEVPARALELLLSALSTVDGVTVLPIFFPLDFCTRDVDDPLVCDWLPEHLHSDATCY